MKRLSTLAAALTLAFAGSAAFADDNSMSQFGGESYKAFEAAAAHGRVALAGADSRRLQPSDDNSMSPWNGDSYKAFEQARQFGASVTIAKVPAAKPDKAERPHVAHLSRTPMPVNPFRDDTAG